MISRCTLGCPPGKTVPQEHGLARRSTEGQLDPRAPPPDGCVLGGSWWHPALWEVSEELSEKGMFCNIRGLTTLAKSVLIPGSRRKKFYKDLFL